MEFHTPKNDYVELDSYATGGGIIWISGEQNRTNKQTRAVIRPSLTHIARSLIHFRPRSLFRQLIGHERTHFRMNVRLATGCEASKIGIHIAEVRATPKISSDKIFTAWEI